MTTFWKAFREFRLIDLILNDFHKFSLSDLRAPTKRYAEDNAMIEVKAKKKACEYVGMKSFEVGLAEDSSEEEVLKYVLGFNDDPRVHGIFLQLPLPLVSLIIIFNYS